MAIDWNKYEVTHQIDWDKYEPEKDYTKVRSMLSKEYPRTGGEEIEEIPYRGDSTIGQDILSGILHAPGQVAQSLAELPEQAKQSANLAITHPGRAVADVGAGALSGVKDLYNLPLNIGQYLGEKGVPGFGLAKKYAPNLRIGDTGLQHYLLGAPQKGDDLLQGLAEIAPFFRAAKFAKAVTPLQRLAKTTGTMAAFSASKNQNPFAGALMGVAGEGLAKGTAKAARGVSAISKKAAQAISDKELKGLPSKEELAAKLTPSQLIKTPLSAEELAKALEQTRGTETSLGDVIENPTLKKAYENIVAPIPFSGAIPAMQRTASAIIEKGKNLVNKLGEKSEGEDVGIQLQQALKKAEADSNKVKNELYDKANKKADDIGLKIGRDNLSDYASSALKDIKKSPELLRTIPKSLIDDLTSMSDKSLSNNLKLTNIFRGVIGDKAQEHFEQGNKFAYNVYKGLKNSLDKDIDSATESEAAAPIKDLLKKANDYYREQHAPFDDPTIKKFTRQGGDPDTLLPYFLRLTQRGERSKLLQKLMSKLDDSKRELVPYAHYSDAFQNGQFNPHRFKQLHEKLGENQKEILFNGLKDNGTPLKKKFDDYVSLVKKNQEPLTAMVNPKTGQRMLTQSAYGGFTPYLLGGAAGLIGGIKGLGIPVLTARAARTVLTSPEYRESLVNKMIKNQRESVEGGKKSKTSATPLQSSLAKALTQAALSRNQSNRRNKE